MIKRYITAFLAGVAACVMLEAAADQLMQRQFGSFGGELLVLPLIGLAAYSGWVCCRNAEPDQLERAYRDGYNDGVNAEYPEELQGSEHASYSWIGGVRHG